jgi:hypothetical protein
LPDADTGHLGLRKLGSEMPPASRRVIDLPALDPAVNGHVELGF